MRVYREYWSNTPHILGLSLGRRLHTHMSPEDKAPSTHLIGESCIHSYCRCNGKEKKIITHVVELEPVSVGVKLCYWYNLLWDSAWTFCNFYESIFLGGPAVAHVVRPRLLITEMWVQSGVTSSEICGEPGGSDQFYLSVLQFSQLIIVHHCFILICHHLMCAVAWPSSTLS